MIQLGETPLMNPSMGSIHSDLIGHVRENISMERAMPWLSRAYPGSRLAGVAGGGGFRDAQTLRINSFSYPTWGAARFGHGHFLASSRMVNEVRKQAFGDDGKGPTAPLRLQIWGPRESVGGVAVEGETFATDVYLLAGTPLGRIDPDASNPGQGIDRYENGLYLLTVVDERYYWGYLQMPALDLDPTYPTDPPEWFTLFEAFADAVGRDIEVDDIAPAYQRCGTALATRHGDRLPEIIDATCDQVGMRLVRSLDGRLAAVTPATALARFRANFDPTRTLRSGGVRFLGGL